MSAIGTTYSEELNSQSEEGLTNRHPEKLYAPMPLYADIKTSSKIDK